MKAEGGHKGRPYGEGEMRRRRFLQVLMGLPFVAGLGFGPRRLRRLGEFDHYKLYTVCMAARERYRVGNEYVWVIGTAHGYRLWHRAHNLYLMPSGPKARPVNVGWAWNESSYRKNRPAAAILRAAGIRCTRESLRVQGIAAVAE